MVTIRKNYLRDITFRNAYVSKFHIYKLNIIYKYKKKFKYYQTLLEFLVVQIRQKQKFQI